MQWNLALSHGKSEVSWFFSSYRMNLGYILELWQRWPFKTRVCSAMSGPLSSYEGQLRNNFQTWQGNRDISGGEVEDPESLSRCHSIIGVPIHSQEESGIITY